MIKRDITETIREYDQNGNLVRESITHTVEDDSNTNTITYPTYPVQPVNPWWDHPYYATSTTISSASTDAINQEG